MTDLQLFVRELRSQVWLNAMNHSGTDVAKALFEVTDEMWEAGIDDAWENAPMQDRKSVSDAFCITWLTLLACKLKKK